MKKIIFGIPVIVIIFGLLLITSSIYAAGSSDKEIEYRPVTLTVLDAQTRQPLEGINVIVVNIIGYERFFIADSISKRIVHFYEYTTNENGIVEIPQFKYRLNRHHYIHTQRIDLNIELRNKNVSIREQKEQYLSGYVLDGEGRFIRSQNEYKAGVILYNCYPISPGQSERYRQYTTLMYNRYTITGRMDEQTRFPSEHEEVIFYLERFTGTN
ncbi:MAG: hypothetical protein FWD47_06230 [Treponema sp.]|nr:hypothetical protein [Treponema sp.]